VQFSLRTVFWVTLCAAIGIVAYRRGYEAGFSEQANQRFSVVNPVLRVYYVSDVVPMKHSQGPNQPDYAQLIEGLKREVLPNTWVDRGGAASVMAFATNASLVVSHDQDGHERVAAYLQRLRRHNSVSSLLTTK
jgi:hypothetical protein